MNDEMKRFAHAVELVAELMGRRNLAAVDQSRDAWWSNGPAGTNTRLIYCEYSGDIGITLPVKHWERLWPALEPHWDLVRIVERQLGQRRYLRRTETWTEAAKDVLRDAVSASLDIGTT